MKTMHLFAGGGGGLLADLILGHTPIVAVEWDKYACDILRERANDGWFNGLHVWEGDVRLFDPSEYTDRVDIIHAGFPCQDISQAGKQAGLGEGTRSGLYREVLRIAGVVRPKIIFLENVSAILSNGLGTVLADLAEMGFYARWCCIKASDVGAPHQRDRWWLMANAINSSDKSVKFEKGNKKKIQGKCREERQPRVLNGASFNSGIFTDIKEKAIMAHADSIGHIHSKIEFNATKGRLNAQRDFTAGCDDVADTNSAQLEREGKSIGVFKRFTRVRNDGINLSNTSSFRLQGQRKRGNAICNTKKEKRQANHVKSNDAAWWEIEPSICRVANGVADWSHKLKALGNGQVPLQAALAFKLLER